MKRTATRLENLEKSVKPSGHLEYWTLAEWDAYQRTKQRPRRDVSQPCDPPLAMMWGTDPISLLDMDVREI